MESKNKFLQTTLTNLQTAMQLVAEKYNLVITELSQCKVNAAKNLSQGVTAFTCPGGFIDNKALKSCYKFVGLPEKAWNEADRECGEYGARLVAIETKAENDFLRTTIEQDSNLRRRDFWTSAHDVGREGRFMWMSTGKRLEYTKWDSKNPDNGRKSGNEEDCVLLDHDEDFYWNDVECHRTRGYICEMNY
ncbi:alpha-N-acetylgalactosamine-specific lectin-like [Lingula anatina]|uniref:Alpha-N-acetylgalactosamine-specific lectin-like n=1 Tax=Lingula anatina TaxID=7574 RepID=A0A1S3HV23_LINAN|nr:alpha-N-acetylgalactosamine-specific lectin-like [Lingula anatina]|eukprot:XP_013388909.1 alpha-N-acetylgalactosamine-specific lectin-like [Lingula anatina]